MKTISKTYNLQTKAVDAKAGIYDVLVSTESRDRENDVVRAAGVDVSHYMGAGYVEGEPGPGGNPVILYAHDYRNFPVGRTLSLKKKPGVGIQARFQFAEWGTSELSDSVRKLWEQGILRAASIGFQPREWNNIPGGGKEYTSIELLEWSIVPVPANAGSLALGLNGQKLTAGEQARLDQALNELSQALQHAIDEQERPVRAGEAGEKSGDLPASFGKFGEDVRLPLGRAIQGDGYFEQF
jgi:HK97 family phage prohead protease